VCTETISKRKKAVDSASVACRYVVSNVCFSEILRNTGWVAKKFMIAKKISHACIAFLYSLTTYFEIIISQKAFIDSGCREPCMLAIKSLKQIVHASVIDSGCREPCMLAIKSLKQIVRAFGFV